jgi:TonB dependent receptor
MYRFTDRLSASARFRVGSNFPAAGYYREEGGVYYGTDVRNTLRVPYYARLDARVNRTFTWQQKRLTLFLEGLNTLDRDNVRLSSPDINRRTLVVARMFTTMMPIVPSIGMLLEF